MNLRTLTSSALLVLAVAACGGNGATTAPASSSSAAGAPAGSPATAVGSPAATGGSPAATGAPTPITVKDFALDPTDVTVSGQASLGVTNAGPTIHNVSIRDASGTVVAATKDLRTGESEVLSFDIPAGTYTLFCSLPGHESLGIKGTLTVTK